MFPQHEAERPADGLDRARRQPREGRRHARVVVPAVEAKQRARGHRAVHAPVVDLEREPADGERHDAVEETGWRDVDRAHAEGRRDPQRGDEVEPDVRKLLPPHLPCGHLQREDTVRPREGASLDQQPRTRRDAAQAEHEQRDGAQQGRPRRGRDELFEHGGLPRRIGA